VVVGVAVGRGVTVEVGGVVVGVAVGRGVTVEVGDTVSPVGRADGNGELVDVQVPPASLEGVKVTATLDRFLTLDKGRIVLVSQPLTNPSAMSPKATATTQPVPHSLRIDLAAGARMASGSGAFRSLRNTRQAL